MATARSLSLSLSFSLPPADPLRSKKRVFEWKKKSVSFRNGGKKKREEKRRVSFRVSFISSRTSLSTPLFFSSLLFSSSSSVSKEISNSWDQVFLLIVVRETRRRRNWSERHLRLQEKWEDLDFWWWLLLSDWLLFCFLLPCAFLFSYSCSLLLSVCVCVCVLPPLSHN